MNYDSAVVDSYNSAKSGESKFVGSLDKNNPNVGTGLVGAPACGDVMKLQIEVATTQEGDKIITDAKFKTFGCGSAIAASHYVTQILLGKNVKDALLITNKEIATHLKLPPVKLHCSILAEDAIRQAVSDYEAKQSRNTLGVAANE
jgi:nitrogen fixation NifU-like protein